MKMEKLTLGVEEEYILIDPETREAASNPPKEFMKDCKDALGEQVTPEFLRCQVEIATPVCASVHDARNYLADMRGTLSRIAHKYDLRLMAASTHPFSPWKVQRPTEAERYERLNADLQGAIRRMLICGTHVHIGLEDKHLRIDVMNQMRYFLPHLLALTTSSPFWAGEKMGMKSYRLSVFDGMPRTGIPETMTSWRQYDRLIGILVKAGVMEDSSKLWWDIRPSTKFPTLEMRVSDMCTRYEDTITVVALYQCITRMLLRLRHNNTGWRLYPSMLIEENRWLAQRHGISGSLIDFVSGECRPVPELFDELLEMIAEDAEALNCVKQVEHVRTIIKRGSSACRQVAIYDAAIEAGKTEQRAMYDVVDHLIEETQIDIST